MVINEFFPLAFKNLKRRKMRSWLTMIGIIISIATIFILISISLGLNAAVQEQFRQLGTDKLIIIPKSFISGAGASAVNPLTDDDISTLKRVSGVKDYSAFSMGNGKIEYNNQVRFVNVIGYSLKHFKLFSESGFINMQAGSALSQGDSGRVMIGSQYADSNFFGKAVGVGSTIKINGQNFRVKGILESRGNAADDKMIYMSQDDFNNLFPAQSGKYAEIIVQVDSTTNIDVMTDKVEKALINSRGVTKKTEDFSILGPAQLLAAFGTVLNILTGFLLGIATISLVVGAIGITNTMYTAVLERTKEIGVMKAVGARNFDIMALFTVESGMLGMIGGIGGIVLGYLVGKLIELIAVKGFGITLLHIVTPWYLIVGCLAFSFVVGVLAGLIPARHGSKIRPVEALRYE